MPIEFKVEKQVDKKNTAYVGHVLDNGKLVRKVVVFKDGNVMVFKAEVQQ